MTQNPTLSPTGTPTSVPSAHPTKSPTQQPTSDPTEKPTLPPSDSPTNRPTESPEQTTTLQATADAYVRGGKYGNTNHGGPSLYLKTDPYVDCTRRAVVKFDLTGIAVTSIHQAKLRLHVGHLGRNPTHSIAINRLKDSGWSESTVTWNNLNNEIAKSGGSLVMNNPSDVLNWVEIDVLGLLDEEKSILSLQLVNQGLGEAGVVFLSSREDEGYGPQLVIVQ